MISIRKYLNGYGGARKEAAPVNPDSLDGLLSFASHVLDSINQHVLHGDQNEPRRLQLARARDSLRPNWSPEEAAEAQESVARLLAEHQTAVQHTATNQAVEMQHIFAMLNQALIVLSEGSERSVSRLNQIQESLLHASMIQDIVALKSSLADTVQFVKQESSHARETAAQELARLETEVSKSREFLGSARIELAGRPEGIRTISESWKNVVPGEALYLVAFLFERLQAVRQRYGPGVADELIFRAIKERLQPVAPGSTAYRWTASSLVAVFHRQRGLAELRSEVANLNRTPLVHRIALGNRTAVLTTTPSHLVAEGKDSPDVLVEQVDEFTGAAA